MESNLFERRSGALQKILDIHNETEISLKEKIQEVKEWVVQQPHLPEIMDDFTIQNFLIFCKFNTEKAKERIDMYYTVRSKFPEIYSEINPKTLIDRGDYEAASWIPLPKATENMYRVFILNIHNPEMMENLGPIECLRQGLNLQELRLKMDLMAGDIFIVDFKGVAFQTVRKVTFNLARKTYFLYKNVFSMGVKGAYFINCPYFVSWIIQIMKVLMKTKLFKRVHVLSDPAMLTEVLPTEILPRDYGGIERSVVEIRDMLIAEFVKHSERFDELDDLIVDESLRPKDNKSRFFGFF